MTKALSTTGSTGKIVFTFAALLAAGSLTAAEVAKTPDDAGAKVADTTVTANKEAPVVVAAPATDSSGTTTSTNATPVAAAPAEEKSGEKIADATVVATKEKAKPSPYLAETNSFKRPTPILQTPQSVTVISNQILRDRQSIDLKDALRSTPSITYAAGEGGNSGGDNFLTRGFSLTSDVFIDGIRDTAIYSRDTFAIEQVEISKGASGTYVGRGSAGASVNLSTKTAHAGTAGTLDLIVSSATYVRSVADVNYDISENVESLKDRGVAFRMAAMVQDGGTARAPENPDTRVGLAPTLTYGLGKQTRVTVSDVYYNQQTDGDYGVPFGPPLGSAPLANATDYSNYELLPVDKTNWYGIHGLTRDNTEANIVSAIVESEVDEHTKVRNTTRYNTNIRDSFIYRPNGGRSTRGTALIYNSANPALSTIIPTQNTRYVETTVLTNQTDFLTKFKTGEISHTLNFGAELQEESSSNRSRLVVGATPALNLFNPNPNTATNQGLVFSGAKTVTVGDTYSVYLNDTVNITKWLDLAGGVRYDRFEATTKNYGADLKNTAFSAPVPNVAAFTGGVQTTLGPGQTASFKNENDLFGYRGAVILKPTDRINVYGSISNTYIPSAQNLTLSSGNANSGGVFNSTNANVDPTQIFNYELGSKWEAIKERLTLTAAVFYIDAFDVPTVSMSNPLQLENIGEQTSYGVEFSAAGSISEDWTVFANANWVKTKIKKGTNKGKELNNTPDFTGGLWTTYDFGGGWRAGVGVNYTGQRWADAGNTLKLKDYVTGDLALYKDLTDWCQLQANVFNIADTRYTETGRGSGDAWATPGIGRTITASVRMKF